MSNSLAIATVTASLRKILENAFNSLTDEDDQIANATVTTLPPDDPGVPLPPNGRGANIFLYQTTPNPAMRNTDLPTRNANGDLMARPRVALDLHYLFSFYGNETHLEPQRLLAIAIRTLHTQPVLSRTLINQTIATPPAGLEGILTVSNLADEIELVRFTQAALTVEELARVWSVFAFQTKYKLSLIYQASVVLIDRDQPVREALPVRIRNVYVDAAGPPIVEQVVAQPDPQAAIVTGSTIAILGRGLRGARTRVLVDGDELTPPPTDVTPTRITLVVPASVPAGTRGLQVVLLRDMGTPPTPHRGSESNVAPFVLRPTITAVVLTVDTVTEDPDTGVSFFTGTVAVTVTPNVGQAQRVALLLNELQTGPEPASRAYVFNAPSRPQADPPSPTVTVGFDGVAEGSYVVRLRVDGATSDLNPAFFVELVP